MSMSKPTIGVFPLFDIQRDSLWMIPGYMDALIQSGAIPIMLPLLTDWQDIRSLVDTFDGFLFTGGQDIDPAYYHEAESEKCGEHFALRDTMEYILFHEALKADKPLFGICRGIQAFNVFCGGSLYQDLPSQKPSPVVHCQSPPYDEPVHSVSIIKDTPLYTLLNTDRLKVNSYHHQAIKELSPLLYPMAYSEDRLVEAVYMPEKSYVWAVQWHPELSYQVCEESRLIWKDFVDHCKELPL